MQVSNVVSVYSSNQATGITRNEKFELFARKLFRGK